LAEDVEACKRPLRRAKKAEKESKPFWMVEREQRKVAATKRRQEFLDEVNSIEL
jgi:hypothetical protein